MEARKDCTPSQTVILSEDPPRTLKLQADQRAHYLIEAVTGLALAVYLRTLSPAEGQKPEEVHMSVWMPLLWGLSATERVATGERHTLSEEDIEHGLKVPSSFVVSLPINDAWFDLIRTADRLIGEAWSSSKGAAPSGN